MWCKRAALNPTFLQTNQVADICGRLASYEDVRMSYPTPKPPLNKANEKEIKAWWLEFYEKQVGALHLIKWHRIVLDGMCGHCQWCKYPDR